MSTRNILMAAGGSADDKLYVDDVFSAYTYTGNGSTQTINNGIDLAGKGGLVWTKGRFGPSSSNSHALVDTARGVTQYLSSDITSGNTANQLLTSFGATGYTLDSGAGLTNAGNATSYVSWVFAKASKFFDVVTWIGNGANRTITHALGQEVGMMLVKRTDSAADWQVYHRSLANTEYMVLNSTTAKATGTTRWNSTTATTSNISLGNDATVNASGGTYIAYLFAHDTSADGIIQCGGYTGNGDSPLAVTLGWEPQFLLVKNVSAGGSGIVDWVMLDTARGINTGSADSFLRANTAEAENTGNDLLRVTPTGFQLDGPNINQNPQAYIYLAIRRPNKPPTTGTQVYNAVTRAGTGAAATVTGVGFAPDAVLFNERVTGAHHSLLVRLIGNFGLRTSLNVTEANYSTAFSSFDMNGISVLGNSILTNTSGGSYINHFFKRAPGVFDVVCYTGTNTNPFTLSHNLEAVPELIIHKTRSVTGHWFVYAAAGLGIITAVRLNIPDAASPSYRVIRTTPSAATFTVDDGGTFSATQSGTNHVVYLFATKAGISKVGSYTGNGSSQTINCGFSAGARFVLIKRTDSTGDWYVWDTARGVVAANDPHLSLNTTAAEVTTNDSVDPDASGFIVNQVAATNINVSGGQYLFLAIA